jgi:hypothetical protein
MMGKQIPDFNWRYYNQSRVELENIEREEYMREMAEDAYTRWLYDSYPDAKKLGFKSPITDHEKFMWIEGYMKARK